MYTYMRLTHVRLTHITFSLTNRMACALVNNFTPNLLLYNYIFIYKLTCYMRRDIALQRLITLRSLSLLHCITLYYSCPPPLLILRSFLPPFHLLRSRYFIHLGYGGYQFQKIKYFLLLCCHEVISVSQSNCRQV